MKIVKAETFKVLPRWLFLRLETNDGFVGWGEPIVEGKADTVAAAVHELCSMIMDKNVNNIEDIWQTLYRGSFYRGGAVLTSAISGIDQALWDIKGKRYSLPVYEFMGGAVRNRMEVYSWIDSNTPEESVNEVKKRIDDGFRNIKMFGTDKTGWINDNKEIDKLISKVDAIRSAAGYELGIAIDFHGRVHKGMAKTLLKELEKYRILFVEEPVLVENEEAFKELHACSSIPLATGERSFTRWDFKRMLHEGYVDIVQPDLSHAGGISETKKIAAMAECYDVALAPHCPLGPIAFASCLQIDFSSINACIQEQSLGMAYNKGSEMDRYIMNKEIFDFSKGSVELSSEAGLGIKVNEESIREMSKVGHLWRNQIFTMEDGSVTEW